MGVRYLVQCRKPEEQLSLRNTIAYKTREGTNHNHHSLVASVSLVSGEVFLDLEVELVACELLLKLGRIRDVELDTEVQG